MMNRSLHVVVAVALLGVVSFAANKTLVNVDRHGVGLQGHDPVAFFSQNLPVKGKPEFTSIYKGVIYQFASSENRDTFNKAPAGYEPQFGGYCAYGASKGTKAPIKIEAFQIVNGRLLMQYDTSVRDRFSKDAPANLKLADDKWPGVVEQYGK
jgi:YHS domain-containing protein